MLHNTRHEPPAYQTRVLRDTTPDDPRISKYDDPEHKQFAWRRKMTLCMAALCKVKEPGDRIVICGDAWIETEWAGGNIGFKVSVAGPQLPTLYAGDPSQAE